MRQASHRRQDSMVSKSQTGYRLELYRMATQPRTADS